MNGSPLRDRMVFLVGAQRSGTNWLQRMLAAHPGVAMLPSETQLFNGALDLVAERVQSGILASPSTATVYADRSTLASALREFCDRIFGELAGRLAPDAARVVERSPNHVEHLELIGTVYPDAWFVHIIRDGRDVASSIVAQPWGPQSIAEAARLWARSIESARRAAPKLARYREVRYDELLAEPAGQIGGLFEWLGIESGAAEIEKALAEAEIPVNTTASSSVVEAGRWRREWSVGDYQEFLSAAGETLRRLGYDPTPPDLPRRRSRVRGGRSREPGATVSQRPYLPQEVRQRRVNDLCAGLVDGDVERTAAGLADSAEIRVVTASGDNGARGPDGRAVLAAYQNDGGNWGTQIRGDVYPTSGMWTVVMSCRHDDRVTDRVLVIRFGADDLVSSLALYEAPFA